MVFMDGYHLCDFEKVIEKEGEDFLFSCWRNGELAIKLQVSNYQNFLPTAEQVEIGLNDEYKILKRSMNLEKMSLKRI